MAMRGAESVRGGAKGKVDDKESQAAKGKQYISTKGTCPHLDIHRKASDKDGPDRMLQRLLLLLPS